MDAREIEICIDQFGTDIYRFCRKLCATRTDAEDLYQQTFLKALETEWTLDWQQNPKALFFLWHIIYGRVTDESRPGAMPLLPVAVWTEKQRYCPITEKIL